MRTTIPKPRRWRPWGTTAGAPRSRSKPKGRTGSGSKRGSTRGGCGGDLAKRVSGQDVAVELKEGDARRRRRATRSRRRRRRRRRPPGCRGPQAPREEHRGRLEAALADDLDELMRTYPDRRRSNTTLRRVHDGRGPRAVPPRRLVRAVPALGLPDPARHGTLRDVAALVPDVAELGFDVLYLPPIHPIGRTNRRGSNNVPSAGPDDPGSPWAIGSAEGPHRHPPRARHVRRLRAPPGRAEAPRHGVGHGPGLPVLSRPPLGDGASRVVPASRRRDDPLRREPAQDLRGHLPPRLRDEGSRRVVERAARGRPVLDREGRRSSGWTIRTRSRSRSGSGCSRRRSATIPTCCSSRRRSRARA